MILARPAILVLIASAALSLPVAPALARPGARASVPARLSAPAARGLAFAKDHCTACHAIAANGSSPNPESPPFDDIANRPGVTARTFATFLADAHNYPAAMDFKVNRAAIGDLAAYMLTLRKPGYRPTR